MRRWKGAEAEEADPNAGWVEVVGVVPDLRFAEFDEADDQQGVYVPMAQDPQKFTWIIVKTRTDPVKFSEPLRRERLAHGVELVPDLGQQRLGLFASPRASERFEVLAQARQPGGSDLPAARLERVGGARDGRRIGRRHRIADGALETARRLELGVHDASEQVAGRAILERSELRPGLGCQRARRGRGLDDVARGAVLHRDVVDRHR